MVCKGVNFLRIENAIKPIFYHTIYVNVRIALLHKKKSPLYMTFIWLGMKGSFQAANKTFCFRFYQTCYHSWKLVKRINCESINFSNLFEASLIAFSCNFCFILSSICILWYCLDSFTKNSENFSSQFSIFLSKLFMNQKFHHHYHGH